MPARFVIGLVASAAAVSAAMLAAAFWPGSRPHAVYPHPPALAVAPPGWSLVAGPARAIPRYISPGGSRDGTVPSRWYGAASELPVAGQQPGWLRIRLATRPNGSTAWVRRADVTLTATPYRIVVSLRTRHLRLFHAGRLIMNAPAGIGTPADPTPAGHFFVAFFERSPNAGYGPFILVTSAHSQAITDWEHSGDAVIGIHGPLGAGTRIGADGAALSHGCIRLLTPALRRLRRVPAGTPIIITS